MFNIALNIRTFSKFYFFTNFLKLLNIALISISLLTQRMSALIPPCEHPVVRRVFIQKLSKFCIGVLVIYFSNFRDHLTPCLVPLPVTRFFVKLLNNTFSSGTVFQRKLGNDSTQFVGFGKLNFMQRNAKPETKFIETVYYSSVYFSKDHNTFGAVGQKL